MNSQALPELKAAADAACTLHVKASAGMSCLVLSAPVVEVIEVEGAVVTWTCRYRLSHLAQSGSDWGEQYITIRKTELRGDDAPVHTTLAESVLPLTEHKEPTYDDAGCAAAELAAMKARMRASL